MWDEPDTARELESDRCWFVYLLAATDCSAFKVGFSCNPLQRLYSFNHRYFETFDLAASQVLRVVNCDLAREYEANIKSTFSDYRTECPAWVLPQAGGDTEWFSAVHFDDAQAQLARQSPNQAALEHLEALVRSELVDVRSYFESWALAQGNKIVSARAPRERALAAADARTLRDWLDAYRHLGIPIFVDDPEALQVLDALASRATIR